MKVLYSPQANEFEQLMYTFDGEKITANLNGQTDVYDFSSVPEGKASTIVSDLPIKVVLDAYRENGVLFVTILNFIGHNATQEECFPDWIEV